MALGIAWLRFWGDTIRGRALEGQPYASGGLTRWQSVPQPQDPPKGLIVMNTVERILDSLDCAENPEDPMIPRPYRTFAYHRYVLRRPTTDFKNGRKIENILLHSIKGSQLSKTELEKARLEIRLESIRIAKANATARRAELRRLERNER